MHGPRLFAGCPVSMACMCAGKAAGRVRPCSDTLLVHCLTVLMSSWMTMSMHFRQGSFSLMICFFTMASNARSGVNRPVLRDTHTHKTDVETWTAGVGVWRRVADMSGHTEERQMRRKTGKGGKGSRRARETKTKNRNHR